MRAGRLDDPTQTAPMPWIERFASLIAPPSRVLDVASGPGRHSRFFAARGCPTLAVDRDATALAVLDGVAGVTTLCADLERDAWPLAGQRFDAVVVTHYLHRPLFPRLLDAVADDGVLLYATFAVGNEAYGKPSNPDFLLRTNELLDLIDGRLDVVAFEQGVTTGERAAVVQRIAAVGRARKWPSELA
jgi:SAM-dependent methyltransferase